MRYLILLTFILYEAQNTHGTKHLEYLKSLLSKHLPSTTDQSIVYELQPVYDDDDVEDDTVAEWNKQEYLIHGNPVDQQSFDKLDIIPGLNFGTVIEENPKTNLKENADGNSKILLNSEIIYEANPGIISKANTGTDFEVNSEIDSAANPQQTLVKDKNTEWLLSETTSEKQPEIVDVKNNVPLFKELIIQKINSIKSNIKLKNQPIIKPVVEEISEDSSFLLGNEPCTNNSITEKQSTSTENPCETKSTTTKLSTTTEQPCITKSTTAIPSTDLKPITTEKPCITKSTTAIPTTTQKPITTEKPIITIKTTTTVEPIITTEPYISEEPVICDTSPTTEIPITSTTTAAPSVSKTSTISPKPIVPVTSINTKGPNSNTFNVDINTTCEEPIITIPSQYQISLPPQSYYYSPLPYQFWLNECLTRRNCFPSNQQYASNPIPAHTFATRPLTLGSMPYIVQEYPKQKVNLGHTKVINHINIDARPTNSGPIKQWNHYGYDYQRPIYYNSRTPYAPQTLGSKIPFKTVYSSSGSVHSKQTNQPITANPTNDSVLSTEKINMSQPLSSINLGQRMKWINNDYNRQKLTNKNPISFTFVTQTSQPKVPSVPGSSAVYSTQTNQPIVRYPVDGSPLPANNIKIDTNQQSYPTNPAQSEQWINYAQNNQQLVSSNTPQTSGPEAPPGTAIPYSSVVYSTPTNQPIAEYPNYGSVLPVDNTKIDANQLSYPTNPGQAEQWINYGYNHQNIVPSYIPQSSGTESLFETSIPNSGAVFSAQNNQPISGYHVDGSVLPDNNIKINTNQQSYPTNSAQAEQWINYAYNNQQAPSSNPPQSSGSQTPSGTAIPKSGTVDSAPNNQPISEYSNVGSVIPSNNIKIDTNQPSYPINPAQAEQWTNYAQYNQQLVPSNPPQSSGAAIPESEAVYSAPNNQPISGYRVDGSVLPSNNIKIDTNQPSYPINPAQAEQWINYALKNQQLVSSNAPQRSAPEAPSGTIVPGSSVIYSTQTNQQIAGYPIDGNVLPANNIKINTNQPSYPINSAQAEQWINNAQNNQQLVSSNAPKTSELETPSGTAISYSDAVYSAQNNQPITGYPVDGSVLPASNIKIDPNQPSYPINSAQAEQWIDYAQNSQQLVSSNPPQSSGPETPSAIPNSGAVYSTETFVPITVYPTGDSVSPGEQTNLANSEYIDPNQYYDAMSEANGSGAPLRGDIRFGEDYTTQNTYEQSGRDETLPNTLKQRRQTEVKNNKQTSVRNSSDIKMPISKLPTPDKPVIEHIEAEIPAASDAKPKTPLAQTKKPVVKGKAPTVEIESPKAGKTVTPVTITKTSVIKSDDNVNLKLVKKMLNSKSG
jgi:hypothetical protein